MNTPLQEAEMEFREALSWGGIDGVDPDRKIHINSFDGAYGVAGYVLAVNGSPPHGTVIIFTKGHSPDTRFMEVYVRLWGDQGKMTYLGDNDRQFHNNGKTHRLNEAAVDYLNLYLKETTNDRPQKEAAGQG